MQFSKPYLPSHKLIYLLQTRGLKISDKTKAEEYLKNIGYYRLSAYFYPFLTPPKITHQFKAGSTFKKVMDVYRFDRKLRLIIFNEIEKIEIAVRSTIVDVTTQQLENPFWITSEKSYARKERFTRTLCLIDKEYNHSKEDFIEHFQSTYSNPYPPSWELAEILPLGILTRIYQNIQNNQIRKKIAQRFELNIPVFESWMTIITLTRNSCCHHTRMWNKQNSLRTLSMKKMSRPWIDRDISQRKIFYNMCIIKYFIDIISPNNHFKKYLLELFDSFPSINKSAMVFPENWE